MGQIRAESFGNHDHFASPSERSDAQHCRNMSPKGSIWSYRTTICHLSQKIGPNLRIIHPFVQRNVCARAWRTCVFPNSGNIRFGNFRPSTDLQLASFGLGGAGLLVFVLLKVFSWRAYPSPFPVFSLP